MKLNHGRWILRIAVLLLFLSPAPAADAATLYALGPGSAFFDFSSGITESLVGTITTELIEFPLDFRQNIIDIDIHGATRTFVEANFFGAPHAGGAVDIRKSTGQIVQVQLILGPTDGSVIAGDQETRFDTPFGTGSFEGPLDAPTSITLTDAFPFITEKTIDLDIDEGDRLFLFLRVANVPEPATFVLLAVGLAGMAWARRRLSSS